jgi:hypothetical protein
VRCKGLSAGLIIFLAAYAVLTFTWVMSNPPYAAPDEWAHFVRATSIGYGQLVGSAIPAGENVLGKAPPGVPAGAHEEQERWTRQNTRRVSIPRGHTPAWFGCSADPLIPATCLTGPSSPSAPATWAIPTGNYQPFPYLLPALVSRLNMNPNRLDRLMRAVKALLALVLLAVAFLVLWVPRQRALSALGLVVAVTPMVVFLAGSLNPSGLEITAAIAFFACLLRLWRSGLAPTSVWVGLGASGAVVALSRGEAPVWIVLDLAVFFMLTGRQGLIILRRGGSATVAAFGFTGVAIVLNRVWESLYGPHFVVDPTPLGVALRSGWFELPEVLREEVGVFDYLEFRMSPLAYMAWFGLVAALVATALLVGSRRERLVLCLVSAAAIVLPIGLVAAIMQHTGYGLQGRYVLAFTVVVPLLAGEVVFRHRAQLARLNSRAIVAPFAAVAALVHADGLYANARRFAVGTRGPDWFVPTAVWSPHGGWWAWLVATALGGLLLALAAPADSLGVRARAARLHRAAAADDVSR